MQKVGLRVHELPEEQTEIITHEASQKDSKIMQQQKQVKYMQAPTPQASKNTVILLLLIMIAYLFYSIISMRNVLEESQNKEISVNGNSFKKQQKTSIVGPTVYHIFQQMNHTKIQVLESSQSSSLKKQNNQLTEQNIIKEKIDRALSSKQKIQTKAASKEIDLASLELLQNGKIPPKFIFPSIIWLYLNRSLETQTYINSLTINNNIRLAKQLGYTVNTLKNDNYDRFLSKDTVKKLDEIIEKIYDTGKSSEIVDKIIKYLVISVVMEEQGGVLVDEYVSLLEGFEWLQDIGSNIFVNRGAMSVEAQVFAFFSVEHSSQFSRQNKSEISQVKQYMRLFPAVEPYFLAARPHSAYFSDIKKQILHFITKKDFEIHAMARELQDKYKAYKYQSNIYQLWNNIFIIASQRILVREQQKINQNKGNFQYAIDFYGLKTINKYYFPEKLDFVFTKYQYEKTFTHLSRHTREELQTTVGPLRYISIITPRGEVDYMLSRAKEGSLKHPIIIGSFLQIYLFNDTQQKFIIPNPQKKMNITDYKKWTKLPKIIWLFWDKGFSKSHATNQLAKRNIEHYAGLSGFRVIEVNQSNLKKYIGTAEIERIDETMYFNNRGTHFDQTYSDLVRLALLIKHGGVYMDAAFIMLQDLSWLIDIAVYPPQYVFNRYGQLPSVFMFINPHYGSQYDEWEVDESANTKTHWHFSYQNNFIACEPQNELIITWFNALIGHLSQPYSQTQEQFKECGIYKHKWSSSENTYLLPMDTIKCVIGKKQKELLKQKAPGNPLSLASQYYKLWSISGFNGVQKFRGFTNFQNPGSDDNLFFRRYSEYYVSSLIGRPRQLIKLYSINNINLNNFIRDNLESKIFHEIHLNSFFNRYLFSMRNEDEDFIIVNDNLLIKQKAKNG